MQEPDPIKAASGQAMLANFVCENYGHLLKFLKKEGIIMGTLQFGVLKKEPAVIIRMKQSS